MKRRNLLIAAPFLLIGSRAFAHHGWSSFDEARPLYIVGKIKALKWQNPHVELTVTMAADATLPADLAKRVAPAQTNPVNGAKILSSAVLPKRRGDWELELSPMSRIEAWKVPEPKVGDTLSAVAYTFKDEKGAAIARVEYLMIGAQMYGLRSMPV